MNQTQRKRREDEFLRNLQSVFADARKVESFEDSTLYAVEFGDGTEQQVTLHFDEE